MNVRKMSYVAAALLGTAVLGGTAITVRNHAQRTEWERACGGKYKGERKFGLGSFDKIGGRITDVSLWEGDFNYQIDLVKREIWLMSRSEMENVPVHYDRSQVILPRHFVGSNNGTSLETAANRQAYWECFGSPRLEEVLVALKAATDAVVVK